MQSGGLPSVRLLHTADVHLDGSAERQSTFTAVVDLALDLEVDVFVIAGDLFDHARLSSTVIDRALDDLSRMTCDVVLVPGNHDQLDDTSIYLRTDLGLVGPHLHFFGDPVGRWVRFEDLKLAVWGRGTVDHDPSFRPLATFESAHPDCWRVAVAHGFYVPAGTDTYRSSPITEAEIGSLECDYLALGHWHHHRDISSGGVIAHYAGSPSEGDRCVNLVELNASSGIRIDRIMVPEPS